MKNANSLMKNQLSADDLVIGGLTPLTTIDFPGQLAAVIFLQGCPWRCGYCQNGSLLPKKNVESIAWQDVLSFLQKRKGLIDAVVFSGGEPTMQLGLCDAMQQVKSLGFKVGLHSAGIFPLRLQKLLPYTDWVGLDVKAAKNDYAGITNNKHSGERAWESVRLLLKSGVKHELRTTLHSSMLNKTQIENLFSELSEVGAENYVVQECITKNCFDKNMRVNNSATLDWDWLKDLSNQFEHFNIRSVDEHH